MGRKFLCIKERFQFLSAGGLVPSPSPSPSLPPFFLLSQDTSKYKNILKIDYWIIWFASMWQQSSLQSAWKVSITNSLSWVWTYSVPRFSHSFQIWPCIQMVPDLWWFHWRFFNFMMGCGSPVHSVDNRSLHFDLLPGWWDALWNSLAVLGSGGEPWLPVSHANDWYTCNHSLPTQPFCLHFLHSIQ